jgi:outer membrane protein W
VYYGISLFNNIYKNAASAGATNVQFKSLGPVGLMFEHFVTDKIGLGVELGYTKFEVSYNVEGYTTGTTTAQTYKDTWSFTTVRAMFRSNFHFIDSKSFDAYAFFSVGYRSTSFKFSSTDPNSDNPGTFSSIIPFGFKPGIGIRYFFTPNIGLNAEFALGTPLIGGGLSFKF